MGANGEMIEVQYDKNYGMQNAMHLAMKSPSKTLFEFLSEELKINPDSIDYQGRNPFLIGCTSNINKDIGSCMTKLLEMNVRFDLADSNNRTAFLHYYAS